MGKNMMGEGKGELGGRLVGVFGKAGEKGKKMGREFGNC
jgi:hypothetical protein